MSSQVCGLWPFSVGAGAPLIGVPVGRHLETGAPVCCDPISWFQLAKLIGNPSAFLVGLPHYGKSQLVLRMIIGLAAFGVVPLITGDRKGEYAAVVRALDGSVNSLGQGIGHVNILDPGNAVEAAKRLPAAARVRLLEETHTRVKETTAGVLSIARKGPLGEREENVLDESIRMLHRRQQACGGPAPVLPDLLNLVREAPPELREVALDRGDDARYREITEGLEASLQGLISGGRLGRMFHERTTEPPKPGRPVVYDISGIPESNPDGRAAAQVASWAEASAMMGISTALADAGLAPRMHFVSTDDELWSALRAGSGLVERFDATSRLNRNNGFGSISVTHTSADLEALPAEDRTKAAGLIDRAGMLISAALPPSEFEQPIMRGRFTNAEKRLLTSWVSPPAWSADDVPLRPHVGKFLIKVGERPGIPFQMHLTQEERDLHDTNERWASRSRLSGGEVAQ